MSNVHLKGHVNGCEANKILWIGPNARFFSPGYHKGERIRAYRLQLKQRNGFHLRHDELGRSRRPPHFRQAILLRNWWFGRRIHYNLTKFAELALVQRRRKEEPLEKWPADERKQYSAPLTNKKFFKLKYRARNGVLIDKTKGFPHRAKGPSAAGPRDAKATLGA
jgi:hypothetical protein